MADTDTIAQPIFTALTTDLDLSTPVVNLSDPDFEIPSSADNPLYEEVSRLTEDDLTTRVPDGNGLFDGLMASIRAHLKEEHQANRISGQEYTKAYIAMTQVALGQAVSYLLNRDQSLWSARLAQAQAKGAEAEVVRARLAVAMAREELKTTEIAKQKAAADYALTKQQLALGEAQYDLTQEQIAKAAFEVTDLLPKESSKLSAEVTIATNEADRVASTKTNIDADTDIKTYQVTHMLPLEKTQLEEQIDLLQSQDSKVLAETTLVTSEKARVDAQTSNIEEDTAVKSYQLLTVLPAEKLKLDAETRLVDDEASRVVAQKDNILAETASIIPARMANIAADTNVKDYQHQNLMPAQVDKTVEERLMISYEKDFIKPAQLASINEQMEAHRAKTLDTRSDGTTPIAGAIGKQKDLHAQQITSYERDAETKVVKMILDTWITQKSVDENLPAPTSIQDSQINSALTALRNNLSL